MSGGGDGGGDVGARCAIHALLPRRSEFFIVTLFCWYLRLVRPLFPCPLFKGTERKRREDRGDTNVSVTVELLVSLWHLSVISVVHIFFFCHL